MIPRALFSQEHEAFRASVRHFVETEIVPQHPQWERDGIVSREIWRRAGKNGFLCCSVPTKYGGADADLLAGVVVAEALAYAGTTGPYFHLHSDVVSPYLVRYGSEEIKHKWLPRMVSGEAIGALALSEPGIGSDLQSIKTTARRDGDSYVIDGQKTFVSNGQLADVVVLAAQLKPGAGAKGIGLFVVDTSLPGFERGKRLEKIGLKAQDTSELFFRGLRVPAGALLEGPGRGFAQLMEGLVQERLMQAVRSVSASEAVIEWTLEYVCTREAFGNTIWDFQNTQFKLAELHALTQAQRVLVDRCLELQLEGRLSAVDAAVLKINATEAHGRVVDEALQLFGGWGYMWEYPIARAFADARQARLAGGTIEVMKQIVARELVKERT